MLLFHSDINVHSLRSCSFIPLVDTLELFLKSIHSHFQRGRVKARALSTAVPRKIYTLLHFPFILCSGYPVTQSVTTHGLHHTQGSSLYIKKCNHCNHIIEYIENLNGSSLTSLSKAYLRLLTKCSRIYFYTLAKWVTGLHLDKPGSTSILPLPPACWWLHNVNTLPVVSG
jgi:hypothetical protein